MQTISLGRITAPIRLADFAIDQGQEPDPQTPDVSFFVWLNPPRALRVTYQQALSDLAANEKKRQALGLYLLRDKLDNASAIKTLEKQAREALGNLPEGEQAQTELLAELVRETERLNLVALEALAQIFSAGPEESHLSAQDLQTLYDETREDNPRFYPWLVGKAMRLINEYRTGQKKSTPAS